MPEQQKQARAPFVWTLALLVGLSTVWFVADGAAADDVATTTSTTTTSTTTTSTPTTSTTTTTTEPMPTTTVEVGPTTEPVDGSTTSTELVGALPTSTTFAVDSTSGPTTSTDSPDDINSAPGSTVAADGGPEDSTVSSGAEPVANSTPLVVNAVAAGTPSAPVLRATPGNGRVTVAWTAPSNGGSAITRYVIQRSTSPTSGWIYLSTTIPATARSFIATGLQQRHPLLLPHRCGQRLRVGDHGASRSAPSPARRLQRPSLRATPGNGRVTLAWTAPFNGGFSDHPLRDPALDQPDQRVGLPEHHDPGNGEVVHRHRPAERHPLLLPRRCGQRRG